MYSFQPKIGLKKMRKGENKNYRFVPFLPNAKLKIPKIGWKMPKKRENKYYRSFPFLHYV